MIGASWALAFLGGLYFATLLYNLGFFYMFLGFILGSFCGIFFIVIFEFMLLQILKFKESQKQTKLLEQILSNCSK
ncbi:MAG: hypothetical protein HXX81_03260 [Campylobacterales bacterium]|nr:hypothetical protein [Campylobacterales bacterium]